jgi:hypothetical protein
MLYELKAAIYVSNALSYLMGWTLVDEVAGEYTQAIPKCVSLAYLAGRWELFLYSDKWLARAETLACNHRLLLIDAEDLLIAKAWRMSDDDRAIELALQFLQEQRSKPRVTSSAVARDCIRASGAYRIRFNNSLNAVRQNPEAAAGLTLGDIFQALKLANEALVLHRASGGSEMVVNTTNYFYELLSWTPDSVRDILLGEN